ncbi:hypothetical protein [Klebsiella aerogenes]|mgnify:CR=1 FL=1|uniref:hypothetical protein n=1 Tax=Klebsiella aerogenes TaxID=548 RepID=UPI0007AA3AD2|nr:hypothetical protein [Klebsiella aerogenes]SAJ14693.1 Uncharacterised protein [Klebsiella aerogenes]
MTNNQLTDQKLTKIVESAEAVISALAGTNDDVHPDDSTKMCRLWDALNDDDATPEVVLVMAKELQERRKAEAAWRKFQGMLNSGDPAASQQTATVVQDIGEIRVGRLPTMNQDEYPGLGDWWVQLRIGSDSDEVLARVYGATPQEANNRAEALARRAAMLQAEPVTTANKLGNSPVIPDGWKLAPVEPNGDMLAAAQDAYGETDGDIASTLRAAIAAAPQEVK